MQSLMNPWESAAIQYHYPEGYSEQPTQQQQWIDEGAYDPTGIIYPGLYSATGIDMLSILMQVAERPHPRIRLGAVDGSCAMVVCDIQVKDCPIVYVNDPFCELTGYTPQEVLGRNCRFLQAPAGCQIPSSSSSSPSAEAVRKMRNAVRKLEELQLEIVNYTKDGRGFVNMLSMVPIPWDKSKEYRYYVGFLVDRDAL